MAYLKKEYKNMIERMDKKLKLPKNWNYFVKKESIKQNYIIKTNGICTCNNCKTQFISDKKVNQVEKCPKCKQEYIVKSNRLTYHIFENRLVLLDRFERKWVIRLFEIFSRYTKQGVYHSKPVEYARIILKDNLEFVNNRLKIHMYGSPYVDHTEDGKKWRIYNNWYRFLNTDGKVYPGNLKNLLKNTKYKYSELWTLANKEENIDIGYYLKNNFKSTEMLVKMGLYKLALCPENFNKKGSFKERFGISKNYYSFIKKNNLDYDELQILKLYQKEDIDKIKYMKQFDLRDLEEISKYMQLEKFIEYTKMKKNFDLSIYLDYLKFIKELKMDLKDKANLFPNDLIQKHDEYAVQIKIKRNPEVQRKIIRRSKKLQKNAYSNNEFFIKPATGIEDLENESSQQKHCVRTYAERYAKGTCDIYFMRKCDEPDKSLVTVEVRDNKIYQSRTKNNNNPEMEQKDFLKKWEDTVLKAA